jgi:predicted Zn-dependent protease
LVLLLPLLAAGVLLGGGLWIERHKQQARDDLDHFRFPQARHHLDQYLKVWPRDSAAHLLAAQAARRDLALDAAGEHLDEAQRLRGGLTDDIVLERMMLRAQRGEVDATAGFLRAKANENTPDRPVILEAVAFGYVSQQRLQEANFMLQMLLEVQPNNPRGLMMQGWVKEMLNLPDESIESYTRLLALNPADDQARLLLANAYLTAHLPEKAIDLYEQLYGRMPNVPGVQVRYAECLAEMGQNQRAEQLLDDVLARHPKLAGALRLRGRLAMEAGQPAEAEQRLRQAIALEPWDHAAHYQLYKVLNQAGREADARVVQVRLKEIEADMSRLNDIIAHQLGQRPADPALNFESGVILVRSGQPGKGLEFLYRALRADPEHSPTHAVLAEYFEGAGDTQRAAFHRQHVRPGTTIPKLHLSDLPQP